MLKWRPTHLTTATTTLWPLSWDSRWAASMETSSLLVVLNFRTPPSLHHQRLLRPTFPEIVLIATEVTIHWLNSYILDLPWRAIHIMKIFLSRPILIPFRDVTLKTFHQLYDIFRAKAANLKPGLVRQMKPHQEIHIVVPILLVGRGWIGIDCQRVRKLGEIADSDFLDWPLFFTCQSSVFSGDIYRVTKSKAAKVGREGEALVKWRE